MTWFLGGVIMNLPQFYYGQKNKGKLTMLKKFEVKNFKGFKEKLTLDLSNARDYAFNKDQVQDGIIKKSLVYGKNGTGKSNLGLAIFDITWQLTENKRLNTILAYTHGDSPKNMPAYFKYYFQFDNDEIIYEYEKYAPQILKIEKLYINNSLVVYFDHEHKEKNFVKLLGTETLNIDLERNDQSIIRYIYRNARIGNDSPLVKMTQFVNNMLWFRCLNGNEFSGYKKEPEKLTDMIGTEENLQNFAEFLADNDINYDLEFVNDMLNNTKVIIAKFKNNKYPLNIISSTGTDALLLFYCWSLEFDKISFLFLDEFDAFYHYETAEYVLNIINKKQNFQSIVTTHNTSLLNNRLTRPDCCYILSNNQIKSLCNCTDKELREAHNLEKMYRNGIFEN